MRILVLLLGGNNIPNYAIIDYFSRNPTPFGFEKVVLVASAQSFPFVERFKEAFPKVEFLPINLGAEFRNLRKIEELLYRELRGLNPTFIHLNYTGGTKPMSVGASWAVRRLEGEGVEVRYSDISPDSSKLTFFNGEIFPGEGSLTDGVKLKIEELYRFHGLEIEELRREKLWYYRRGSVGKILERWTGKRMDKEFRKRWGNLSPDTFQRCLADLEALQIPYRPGIDYISLKEELYPTYIMGGWLEQYIFDILEEMRDELGLSDLAWNVRGRLGERGFELDVVAIQGYKCYTFSCSVTSRISDIKCKGFEVVVRTEQIGGIRATPILVSLISDENKRQFENDWRSSPGRSHLHLLTFSDLTSEPQLKENLRKLFGRKG